MSGDAEFMNLLAESEFNILTSGVEDNDSGHDWKLFVPKFKYRSGPETFSEVLLREDELSVDHLNKNYIKIRTQISKGILPLKVRIVEHEDDFWTMIRANRSFLVQKSSLVKMSLLRWEFYFVEMRRILFPRNEDVELLGQEFVVRRRGKDQSTYRLHKLIYDFLKRFYELKDIEIDPRMNYHLEIVCQLIHQEIHPDEIDADLFDYLKNYTEKLDSSPELLIFNTYPDIQWLMCMKSHRDTGIPTSIRRPNQRISFNDSSMSKSAPVISPVSVNTTTKKRSLNETVTSSNADPRPRKRRSGLEPLLEETVISSDAEPGEEAEVSSPSERSEIGTTVQKKSRKANESGYESFLSAMSHVESPSQPTDNK